MSEKKMDAETAAEAALKTSKMSTDDVNLNQPKKNEKADARERELLDLAKKFKTNDFGKILLARHSCPEYDPNVKISRDEMRDILEAATTAPSSLNMQPWRFVVVDSDEGKAKLDKIVGPANHLKVKTASSIVMVFGDRKFYEQAAKINEATYEMGGFPKENQEFLTKFAQSYFPTLSEETKEEWIMHDCGLVEMALMLVARAHGYDTNPMDGFKKEPAAKLFDLDEKRYKPVLIVSMGKAKGHGRYCSRLSLDEVARFE
ncbi:nitroreductase family protein [Lactobacillus corticis]|uniref:Nitroreductase n=1 Tax=Lactobacillus corticis TaxID=2201249 RepID=A0A916VH80_9LACO|nr:nitroreductase family protein [Lactobacillus corticis]GFZ26746.1 nitroreductase [Lactobacillus corticis]